MVVPWAIATAPIALQFFGVGIFFDIFQLEMTCATFFSFLDIYGSICAKSACGAGCIPWTQILRPSSRLSTIPVIPPVKKGFHPAPRSASLPRSSASGHSCRVGNTGCRAATDRFFRKARGRGLRQSRCIGSVVQRDRQSLVIADGQQPPADQWHCRIHFTGGSDASDEMRGRTIRAGGGLSRVRSGAFHRALPDSEDRELDCSAAFGTRHSPGQAGGTAPGDRACDPGRKRAPCSARCGYSQRDGDLAGAAVCRPRGLHL
jgi:hypothetical protein